MTPDRNDDLRAVLRRQAESVQPSKTYQDLEQRMAPDARHRPWTHKALVAVAAVLALLVGAGVITLAVDDDDNQGVTTDPPPATSTTTTSTTTAPTTSAFEPSPTTTPPTSAPPTTGAPTTGGPTTGAPTTGAPTTAPPTTAPPTTAAPSVSPITADSRLFARGIGDIRLPVTRDEFEAATGQQLDSPGAGIPGSSCGFVRIVDEPGDVALMTDDDRLVRINVADPAIRTTQGVGVGSTRQQIRTAYPSAVSGTDVYGTEQLSVTDVGGDAKLVFNFFEDEVGSYSAGLTPFVDFPEGCS